MIILLLENVSVDEDYHESISPLIRLHQISNDPSRGGETNIGSKHCDNAKMEDTSITSSTHRDEPTIFKTDDSAR